MMGKKGYMFTVDVTIAIILLVIGIAFLFYNFKSSKTVYFTEQLAEDIIGVLAYTNTRDLCIDPGIGASEGCACPNYPNLSRIVCNENLKDADTNLLSVLSEVIERGLVDSSAVKDSVKEIFASKNIIDEKRFGFAILYLTRVAPTALELYNTECYLNPAIC